MPTLSDVTNRKLNNDKTSVRITTPFLYHSSPTIARARHWFFLSVFVSPAAKAVLSCTSFVIRPYFSLGMGATYLPRPPKPPSPRGFLFYCWAPAVCASWSLPTSTRPHHACGRVIMILSECYHACYLKSAKFLSQLRAQGSHTPHHRHACACAHYH